MHDHSSAASGAARLPLIGCITVGLGTAVAMWFAGYLTHMPGVRLPLAMTAGLMTGVQLAGGVIAGRTISPGVAGGAIAGLVSSLINLLIVGSIVASPDQPDAVRENWWLMVGGTLAFGPVVGALGAFVGSRMPVAGADTQRWLSRLAVVTAISALPVLLSGGIVTSAEAGKAVPDWPGSYGYPMFLFPLQHMTGGIYYEHAHRLFGSLAGFCTIVLTIAVLLKEPRKWVKLAAVIALLVVITQGVAGGMRVNQAEVAPVDIKTAVEEGITIDENREIDTKPAVAWAIFHGVSGQLTFAYLCVVASFLSPRWIAGAAKRPDSLMRTFAMLALGAYLLQLFLGAGLRHTGHAAFQHSHVTLSIVVVVLSLLAGLRARARHADVRSMKFFGTMMAHGVGVQFVIGFVALVVVLPHRDDPTHIPSLIIATTHQFLGALLIAATCIVFAWTMRLVERGPVEPASVQTS